MKIAQMDMGGQFWVEKNDSGHKNSFLSAISRTFCFRNAIMAIMAHAKFHFNQLMSTLIFGIRASEPPFGPGERLKRPGLIRLIGRSAEDGFVALLLYFSWGIRIL